MTDVQLALVISSISATIALTSLSWTIVWSVWQFRRLNQPRITVLVSNATPVGRGYVGETCVQITLVNDRNVAVTVTAVKFMVRGDDSRYGFFPMWLRQDPNTLPVKLTAGDKWTGWIGKKELVAAVSDHCGQKPKFTLWAVAIDAADRKYRRKFKLVCGIVNKS